MSIIFIIIFFILPSLDIEIINHNIKKDIDANVYLYSEIKIQKEWSEK